MESSLRSKTPYLIDSNFVIQKKVVRAIMLKKRNEHSYPLFGSLNKYVIINCPQPTFVIILHVLVICIILVASRQKN